MNNKMLAFRLTLKTSLLQVPEMTANLLMKEAVTCYYRDTIQVKGKNEMKVFLVKNQPMIRTCYSVNSMDPSNIMFNELYEYNGNMR